MRCECSTFGSEISSGAGYGNTPGYSCQQNPTDKRIPGRLQTKGHKELAMTEEFICMGIISLTMEKILSHVKYAKKLKKRK